jgi:hypothetical protein
MARSSGEILLPAGEQKGRVAPGVLSMKKAPEGAFYYFQENSLISS